MLKCKQKGFISKEKCFYTRRKGFQHLKEKGLFEKKSDQKKRKFFLPTHEKDNQHKNIDKMLRFTKQVGSNKNLYYFA